MFAIEFITSVYIYPVAEITLRTDIDGWHHKEITGIFADETWRFELEEERYAGGFYFEFALDRHYLMRAELRPIRLDKPSQGSTYRFEFPQVQFDPPQQTEPFIGTSLVQQRYFPSIIGRDHIYDVIIIGSGMGGGVLADQLSDAGHDVLVLEAGGLIFPTHTANLPRRQLIGRLNKTFWQLWYDLSVRNYEDIDGSEYRGAQGFNLGGRSLFWGGFIPRMTSWELDFWPRNIRWYLENPGYELAEDLMGHSVAPRTLYSHQIHHLLRDELPMFHHMEGPVAVRHGYEGTNSISGGMFSTADLLMESYLSIAGTGSKNLSINLNHAATAVRQEASGVTVEAHDLTTNKDRAFHGRYAVLCAGTIESARLAFRSGLKPAHDLIGRGFTDHTILWNHFRIDRQSRYYNSHANVKILSQRRELEDPNGEHLFNIHFELGSDFNQSRYLDEDLLEQHLQGRLGYMLGEVVFLFHAELQEENHLNFSDEPQVRTHAYMRRASDDPSLTARANALRDRLYHALGAEPLDNGQGLGELGGVAHEVGTLRMEVVDNTGQKRSRPGVVDENCNFIGYERVYVCDLSIFPTSPAANPSLTLVALAIRLGNHLGSLIKTRK